MAECLEISQQNKNDSDSDTEDDDYQEFCDNFTYSQSTSCCICNGYYAANFGEPLCGICHSFLFPVCSEEKHSTDLSDNDEDSGNDEPPYKDVRDVNAANLVNRVADDGVDDANADENSGNNSRRHSPVIDLNDVDAVPIPVPSGSNASQNDRITIYKNAFLTNRPEPEAPRALRQYINALTEARNDFFAVNRSVEREPPVAHGEEAASTAKIPENTIDQLPVEVLLVIFSYLDDISLCHVGEVCKQWRKIVDNFTPQSMWQKYTKMRWPLYHQVTRVTNWFQIYSSLMSSCFCRTCVIQMTLKMPQQGENHFRATRLRGDIRTLDVDAAEGIEAVPLDNQLSHWQASIQGPVGSPYEGGKFFLHIIIPFFYPMHPPVVRFLTKIIHPNVSRHGDVGIDIIQHNWSLALTISKLLLSVQSLLTDPFTEICMEPELGRMYDHDRPRFEALARRYTWKYAMFEVIPF